ncbi:MAG: enoyl-CoA hydratase/isomerase family protein [Dehalococcoidia bacterium]|nr:enoyl-CoA hydratase/isomerase family protein [Dehalococcoidia bacterium]
MALDWIPRAPKDMKQVHQICSEERLQRAEPPRTTYELKPLFDPEGKEVKNLYTAWVTLDNEKMGNSYTLDMLAGVACAFDKASHDPSVVAIVLTGKGDRFFCTGGNVKEYAEYYVGRPMSCQEYMTVYWHIFDIVWYSPKPVIRRVQGMSIGGGEEVSGVCDLTVAADTASFGQVGPKHGSTAMGGACQFKSVIMTPEDAIWNTTSCEQWSAYKMLRKNYILKVVPILKKDGEFIRNPEVITDKWLDGGEIAYGEFKSKDQGYGDEEIRAASEMVKKLPRDASLLDKAVNDLTWMYANLYPQQVGLSLGMVRAQKKVAYERTKAEIIWWWAANALPYGEFDMGMSAFNTSKITGTRDADVIKYRQMLAQGHPMGAELYEAVMPKPKQ